MRRSRWNIRWADVVVLACALALPCGCRRSHHGSTRLDASTHAFDIFWPPNPPESQSTAERPPLLRGDVSFRESAVQSGHRALEIAVTITRPSDEAARTFWNSQLAFSDVPWMDEVRIWDAESRWQWPNVPFLLKRHGLERIERYGGIDPGKRVDNDFAAVLIRSFDVDGATEHESTVHSPLVSAEWQGNVAGKSDIHTVVHVARSDTFVVSVGADAEYRAGVLKVWLIYADFLGSRPPSSWPKDREWAGGILSYCEIRWEKPRGQPCHGEIRFLTPSAATGFNWESWSEHSSPPAQSRLNDVPA